MLVIYEKVKDELLDDEINVFDCDTFKELQEFFEKKRDIKVSISNLWQIVKNKGMVKDKYKIYKIND